MFDRPVVSSRRDRRGKITCCVSRNGLTHREIKMVTQQQPLDKLFLLLSGVFNFPFSFFLFFTSPGRYRPPLHSNNPSLYAEYFFRPVLC